MFPLPEQNFDGEAIISGKDSLREIENALLANHKRLYHLGMEAVAKSTLSEAMNRRNPDSVTNFL